MHRIPAIPNVHYKEIKQAITKKIKVRINKIVKAELNCPNIMKATNTYAIPVLPYSFGII